MTIQMNVAEAKAKLSKLLDRAVAGDDVVIARAGLPIARLVPVDEPSTRALGFLPLDISDSMFDPLDEVELAGWE